MKHQDSKHQDYEAAKAHLRMKFHLIGAVAAVLVILAAGAFVIFKYLL